MTVLSILTELKNASGSNERIRILNENSTDELFKKVVYYTLSNEKIYSIIPDTSWIDTNGNEVYSEKTFDILDRLATGELSGDEAENVVRSHINELNNDDAIVFIRTLQKELRCGVSTTTANKVWKGLIEEYPYMSCSLVKDVKLDKIDFKKGVYSQMKLDGMFISINIKNKEVIIRSRSGTLIPTEKLQNIVQAIQDTQLDNVQIHGEIVIVEKGTEKHISREISNGIMNSLVKGEEEPENSENYYPVVYVWDVIDIHSAIAKGSFNIPYSNRYERLKSAVETADSDVLKMVETKVCYSYQECLTHFGELVKQGYEGTVFKLSNAIWKDGKSKEQIKLKIDFDCDLEIVGIENGKLDSKLDGKPAVLNLKSSDDLLKVNVTIKNEKMRSQIMDNADEWIGKIVVVKSNNITLVKDDDGNEFHSLFLPRLAFDEYRTDKKVADDIERIKSIYQSAIGG